MNPVKAMLMQNIRTGKFEQGSGGVPSVTVEDSILACASSMPKYYSAARLVVGGDDSLKTIQDCEFWLTAAALDLVEKNSWDIPAGAETYRNLSSLAIVEHLRPTWFKNIGHRVMFYNELNTIRKPKRPLEMTIDKWKKRWGGRYKEIYSELNEMANTHLRQMGRRLK